MQSRSLFVLASFLFGATCFAAAEIETEISDKDLMFVPFEPFIPCADGSPAGIYREMSPNSDSISNTNHEMVFLGGGVCTSEENCREKMKQSPFLFSSDSLPLTLKGQTLFSRNATENIVSSNFTRWIVPYCTQDLFVGSIEKTINMELIRSGDDIFEAALNTWKNSLNESVPDILIVAGISAGSIGLMNHIELVQKVSRDANVTKLRLILDSVSIASTVEHAREIELGIGAIVDFEVHPLCNLTYTQSFQPMEIWNIPCCASINCMLENDPALQDLARGDTDNGNERLFLLDSVYDPLAIVSTRNTNPIQLSDTPSTLTLSDVDSFATRIGEIGGARGQQFAQSAYGSQTRLGNSTLWAVTNVVTHPFLLPALEIWHLRCGENTDGLEVWGSNEYVCNKDGIGMQGELIYGLNATAWFTTDSWRLITVIGEPVENIIYNFVYDETIMHGLVQDVCSGPNCVPAWATEPNPAQQLFVMNDEFASIPLAFQIFLLITAGCLMLTYLLRVLNVNMKESSSNKADADGKDGVEESVSITQDGVEESVSITQDGVEESVSFTPNIAGTIKINNISVAVQGDDRQLLKDVSFSLPPGTITALLGPSGAGKSTLLNVLCGQLPDGLQGFQRDEEFETLGLKTSYLRQFGNSSFQNIELIAYLNLTARLYGASKSELETAAKFLRKSFGKRVGEGPNFGGIRIKELSGGQQRTVAIVATMLTKPKLLLLDEPLSGLDSVSSTMILEFLRDLAKERSCAVFLTLHQPSDAILNLIDKTLVLHGGSLKLNQEVRNSLVIHNMLESLAQGEEVTIPRRRSPLMVAMMSLMSSGQGSSKRSSRQESQVDVHGSINVVGTSSEFNGFGSGRRSQTIKGPAGDMDSASLPLCRMKFDLWQIRPLMRRLQLEGGHDFQKMVELTVSYTLVALLLRFDQGSPIQFLFAVSLFCCIPVFIFQPLLLRTCQSYKNHQLELQDGRISSHAYMFATFFYFISMPLAAIAVAIAIGYGILGWDFGTYSDQFLFASLYFLVSHQLGRVLVCYRNGEYRKVDVVYVFYAAYSICLSGALVSPNKLPVYIRWLSFLSVGFWSVTGTMLVHFEEGSLYDVSDICRSLETCILQDGVFLARALGYTPIGSISLSYVVLSSMFVCLFATEYVLMVRKYGSKRQF